MPQPHSINQIVSLSHDAVGWVFTWSWQMLLVLTGAWLALAIDRSRSATLRYRIWLIAILLAAALPLLNVICAHLPGPIILAPLPIVSTAAPPRDPIVPAAAPGFWWPSLVWPALFATWVMGAVVSLGRLAVSFWKVGEVKRAARIDTTSGVTAGCNASVVLPEDARAVPIRLSNDIQSPGLAGLFRPVILLPADIISWTTSEERASILMHELAHITRRDHLVSLLQSILKSLLFFHPMLRYACNQLSLERELACDDRVLALGTEPRAYAESILKAAERSFLTDVVHQTASFASKRKLERRIDMILDTNRTLWPSRQWRFLVLPLALMGGITWLVMPAANARIRTADPGSRPNEPSAQAAVATVRQTQSIPTVDSQTIWTDTVKRGPMVRKVRALGQLEPTTDGRFLAALQVPEVQTRRLELGQPASVDTRMGIVLGKVFHIYPRVTEGTRRVDIILEGQLPDGATSGIPVDGIIEIGRLDDVVYVGRPVHGREDSIIGLFKVAEDGKSATRVQVHLGISSVNSVQVIDGLNVGDKVILSDTSEYNSYDTIRLN